MKRIKLINLFTIGGVLLPQTMMLSSCNNIPHLYHDMHEIFPYLHYVEFDDYSLSTHWYDDIPINKKWFSAGCSSMRSYPINGKAGDFYGRNLDYFYTNVSSFVVKTKANPEKGRLASIGIASMPAVHEDYVIDLENRNGYEPDLEFLPNLTSDGINEKGVVCNSNICSIDDAGDYSQSGSTGESLYLIYAVRYILDHATSADHAIELLKGRNCYINKDLAFNNIHLMIADKDKTYVVELFDGQLHVSCDAGADASKGITKLDTPVMTNTYINMDEQRCKDTWPKDVTPKPDPRLNKICNVNAKGTERQAILTDLYSSTTTMYELYEAMRKVWMSNLYTDYNVPQMANDDVNELVITNDELFDEWSKSEAESNWHDGFDGPGYRYLYNDYHDIMSRHDRDDGLLHDIWVTNHTSLFQFSTKTLWVISEECYTNVIKFTLE